MDIFQSICKINNEIYVHGLRAFKIVIMLPYQDTNTKEEHGQRAR